MAIDSKKYFDAHPDVDVFYVSSDGQHFKTENAAENQQKVVNRRAEEGKGSRGVVATVRRNEVAEAVASETPDANGGQPELSPVEKLQAIVAKAQKAFDDATASGNKDLIADTKKVLSVVKMALGKAAKKGDAVSTGGTPALVEKADPGAEVNTGGTPALVEGNQNPEGNPNASGTPDANGGNGEEEPNTSAPGA